MTESENDNQEQQTPAPVVPHFRVQPQAGRKKEEPPKTAGTTTTIGGMPKLDFKLKLNAVSSDPPASVPAAGTDNAAAQTGVQQQEASAPAGTDNAAAQTGVQQQEASAPAGTTDNAAVQSGVQPPTVEFAPDPLLAEEQIQEPPPAAVLQYQPSPAAIQESGCIRKIVDRAVRRQQTCTIKEDLPVKQILSIGGMGLLALILVIVLIAIVCGVSSQNVSEEDEAMLRNVESTEELQKTLDEMTAVKRIAAMPVVMDEIRENKKQHMLKMLLDHGWVNFEAPESLWLGDAVTEDGEWILNAMLESGCDLNFRLSDGSILLDHALASSYPKALGVLLEKGIDVNKVDKNGSPIIFQVLQEPKSIDTMVQHGAGLAVRNDRMNTPLMEAIEKEYYDSALYILDKTENANQINVDGNTPIMLCLKKNEIPVEVVNKIMTKSYRPNNINRAEETAISLALGRGGYGIRERLIKSGALMDYNDLSKVDNAQFQKFRDLLLDVQKHPIAEKKPVKESGFFSLPFTDREPLPISWVSLTFWVLWFLLGQVSGRMVCRKWAEKEGIFPWLNLVMPLCGPLPWIIPLAVPLIRRLWKQFASKVGLAQQVLFLQADQTEYQFAEGFGDNKAKPVILDAILKLARTRKDYISISSEEDKTVISLTKGKTTSVIKKISSEDGQILVKVLKKLIGIWGSKEPVAGGHFSILCKGARFRVGVSVVPQDNGSERLIISVRNAAASVMSFDDMLLTEQQKARIRQFLAFGSHGLMIVSSPSIGLGDNFTKLILDHAAGLHMKPIWFRDDVEKTQPGAVIKMSSLALMHTQSAELSSSLSSCKLLAQTWMRTTSLDAVLGLARQKPVILSLEGDLTESVKNVTAAAKAAGIPIEDILQFCVRPYPLHLLCPCSQPEEKLSSTAQTFACLGVDGQPKISSGCFDCGSTGWLEPIVVYDVLSVPELEGWMPGMIAASCLTAEGTICQVELDALLKGAE